MLKCSLLSLDAQDSPTDDAVWLVGSGYVFKEKQIALGDGIS